MFELGPETGVSGLGLEGGEKVGPEFRRDERVVWDVGAIEECLPLFRVVFKRSR